MGVPVLVLGASGAGKSTSLRNFTPEEIGILNVAGKPLPFRNNLPKADNVDYGVIKKTLKANKKKCYVIDDSQYLMAFYMFSRAKEKSYDKFTDCAIEFYNLLRCAAEETSPDTVVYFLHHIDRTDDGRTKAKTQGKMLDNQLTLEGLFSIVLLTVNDDKGHYFLTASDGLTPVKTPLGMFGENKIDNDLKMVDTAIREYYGFNATKAKEKEDA